MPDLIFCRHRLQPSGVKVGKLVVPFPDDVINRVGCGCTLLRDALFEELCVPCHVSPHPHRDSCRRRNIIYPQGNSESGLTNAHHRGQVSQFVPDSSIITPFQQYQALLLQPEIAATYFEIRNKISELDKIKDAETIADNRPT